jgi:hypothetical protein
MSTLTRLRPTTKLHPLHRNVVEILRREPRQDATKLAVELSGCTGFRGRRAATGFKSYRTVAEDVLGYMFSQGHLTQDEDGWYMLAQTRGDR